MSLRYHTAKSLLVGHCREELTRLPHISYVTLVWISWHRYYFGDILADEQARKGSTSSISIAEAVCTFPWNRNRWTGLYTCTVAKEMWPFHKQGQPEQRLNLADFTLQFVRIQTIMLTLPYLHQLNPTIFCHINTRAKCNMSFFVMLNMGTEIKR